MLLTILVILLILLLVGSFPVYPYSRDYGWYPSSFLGLLLVVLLILLLLGHI